MRHTGTNYIRTNSTHFASIAVALACFVLGCSTVSVTQDFDETADFSSFHTFGWLTHDPPTAGDPRADSPLIHARIRSAIDRTLLAKGYQKVKSDPDFVVGYHLSLEKKLDVSTVNTHYGYGGYGVRGRWGTIGYPETHVREYEQGTLIIDVAEARTQKLVWRGSGTRRISRNPSPEQVTERVNAAVAEVLAKFPPS